MTVPAAIFLAVLSTVFLFVVRAVRRPICTVPGCRSARDPSQPFCEFHEQVYKRSCEQEGEE